MVKTTTGLAMMLTLLCAAGAAPAGTFIEWEIWCPEVYGDGDMDVDMYEIESLLAAWGPCPAGEECPLDFNDNGYVGAVDLLWVYSHWGPCRCEGDLDGDLARDTPDVPLLQALIDSEPPIDCTPDLDHNGIVDHYDQAIVRLSMDCDLDSEPRADFDEDGDVDEDDVEVVDDALGRSCEGDLTSDGNVDALDMIVLVAVANSAEDVCHWLQ